MHRLFVLYAVSLGRQYPSELCHTEQRFHGGQPHREMAGEKGISTAGSKKKLDVENPNGNAAMCIQCGECLDKCPQEIDIPAELEKVHAILGERGRISDHYDDPGP